MTTSSLPPPVLAERYETIRLIARGGMADVYLANDQVLHRQVAVKVLFDRFASDPIFVARFEREAKSAARLNHPNVVQIYDSGDYDNTHFIVMEYVAGPTLAQKLAADGPMSVNDANDIASQVADALAVAHGGGMVHRDIKPSNILLDPSGRAKVTDFGIARAIEGGGADLTEVGKVIGTAAYFSPEQALGQPVDHRSDLYSLGVVLFEMVAGGPPFNAPSDVAVAYKHVQEPPPAAGDRVPGISPAMETILATLLAKDPADRYQSAANLRADLDHMWNEEPLDADRGRAHPVSGETNATTALDVAPRHQAVGAGATAILGGLPSDGAPEQRFGQAPNRAGGGGLPPQDRPQAGFGGNWSIAAAGVLAALLIGLVFVIISALGSDDGTIAAGEPVMVPTLIGDLQATAANRVREVGLVPNVRFEPNDEEEPGVVFAQDPEPRSEVALDSVVNLIVAAADDTVEVPNVVNKTVEEARQELTALDFMVNIEEKTSGSVEIGRVISQSIEAQQVANVGAEITLLTSTGPEFRAIPEVVGQSQADADRLLREQGFIPRLELVDADPQGNQAGLVIEQSPGATAEAPVGSIVTIRVVRGNAETSTSSTTTPTTASTTTTTRSTTTTSTTRPTTTTTEQSTTSTSATTSTTSTTSTTNPTTTTTESSTTESVTTTIKDPPGPG